MLSFSQKQQVRVAPLMLLLPVFSLSVHKQTESQHLWQSAGGDLTREERGWHLILWHFVPKEHAGIKKHFLGDFSGKTGLENNEPAQHEPTKAWKLEMRACDWEVGSSKSGWETVTEKNTSLSNYCGYSPEAERCKMLNAWLQILNL